MARQRHEELHDVVDRERMICVAGYGQPTITGITDPSRLRDPDAYEVTLEGDGYVALALGPLRAADGSPLVPTFYLEASQGELTADDTVLAALDELLEHGTTTLLRRRPTAAWGASRRIGSAREELTAQEHEDDAKLRAHAKRLRARSGGGQPMRFVTFDERQAEERITRNFFSARTGLVAPKRFDVHIPPAHIELAIRHQRLEDLKGSGPEGDPPIDVVAVGHYVGVRPQAAELALDRRISAELNNGQSGDGDVEMSRESLLLTPRSRDITPGQDSRI